VITTILASRGRALKAITFEADCFESRLFSDEISEVFCFGTARARAEVREFFETSMRPTLAVRGFLAGDLPFAEGLTGFLNLLF
jgi:hypothetical protein